MNLTFLRVVSGFEEIPALPAEIFEGSETLLMLLPGSK